MPSPDINKLGDIAALFTWTVSVKYYLRAVHIRSGYVLVREKCVKM